MKRLLLYHLDQENTFQIVAFLQTLIIRYNVYIFETILCLVVIISAWFYHTFSYMTWPSAWLTALVPYFGRHLWLLIHLVRLIRRRYRLAPPFPYGLWGEVYRTIARYQQRGRKDRKRQLRFVRRFREATYSAQDALVILSKAQRIEWSNPAAETLLGIHWPRDEGKKLTDLLTDPVMVEYMDSEEDTRSFEIIPEHNQSVMLSIRIAPFGERKKQRVVVGRDITKIFHLNTIRRDFVANASHELKTPLTVIGGFLETLSESPLTPTGHRRPLELMRNQTHRMRSIIDDLLMLSRLESAHHIELTEIVPVAEQITAIVDDIRTLNSEQHQFHLALDSTLCILGRQYELHSVFTNLIVNAVKHTPNGTSIEIFWGYDESMIRFSVHDNGPGIASEHLPRLSERFYRADKGRSRDSGGTGLGLAIVKHVLTRHNAHMTIASEVNRGSAFNCYFPIAQARQCACLQQLINNA
jgi:two-component system phosphate regulon sensor histidine kinase PhoR